MKKIYIILTHTGTVLSNIIKSYTKDEFSHISIALDADLTQMYSFGRLNPYNPFWGGFVHEELNKGTYKRFKKTRANVYSLFVSDEQYEKLKQRINYFNDNKEKYRFNIKGLFFVSINKQIRRKNSFYCAEFVRHVLRFSGVPINYLPDIIRPENFKELEGLHLEYQGLFRKYKKKKYLRLEDISTLLQPNKMGFV